MGNAPDIPPEELNLTHMRTITALVGSMQRVQHEVDEIGRQFAASLFRLRSSFDLIDQLFHTAGEAAARLRDNLPKNWASRRQAAEQRLAGAGAGWDSDRLCAAC